ncbi:hypothetical protein ACFXOS_32065 [Streptomyces sp. NPDC059175]|uniref:hypothetical protein n=1 Tax=Streptomyces sp. NPDC059175 TaxID=3346757 RepID=UPI0036A3CC46
MRGRIGAFVEIVLVGLPIDRDEVEEDLETTFAFDGEVTGAGSGMGRCHLDLEIAEDSDLAAAMPSCPCVHQGPRTWTVVGCPYKRVEPVEARPTAPTGVLLLRLPGAEQVE